MTQPEAGAWCDVQAGAFVALLGLWPEYEWSSEWQAWAD